MQRRKFTSSHNLERGFTIVELITAILILSILIAVAVDSVIGYQASARNREREADTAVITQSIERYYRTHAVAVGATYPVSSIGAAGLTALIDNSEATTPPDQTTTGIVIANNASAQTPTHSQYIYQPLNENDTLCTVAPCEKYKLYYKLENKPDVIIRDSLRQQ